MPTPNLILIGPPGCGKGTLAKRFAHKWHLRHIEMSKLLRALNDQAVNDVMDRGELVSCQKVNLTLMNHMKQRSLGEIRIFDGVPRTHRQLLVVQDIIEHQAIKDSRIIFFDVSFGQAWSRINRATDRADRIDSKKKVTLCRRLSHYFQGLEGMIGTIEEFDPVVVDDPRMEADDVLAYVERELGLEAPPSVGHPSDERLVVVQPEGD